MKRIFIFFILLISYKVVTPQSNIKDSINMLIPQITSRIFGNELEYAEPFSSNHKSYFLGTKVVLKIEQLLNPDFSFNTICDENGSSTLSLYDYYQIQSLYVNWWTKVNHYPISKIRKLRKKQGPLDDSDYHFSQTKSQ